MKNLEEKQLISRRTDASDRRNTVVALTDKGRKVKAQADEIAACFFSKVTEKFGKDNLDKLKTLLTQFYRAVAEVSADFDFDIKTELPSGDSANNINEREYQCMLKLTNITKVYRAGDTKVEALKGVSIEFRKKRVCCGPRTVRVRQNHTAEPHRRVGPSTGGDFVGQRKIDEAFHRPRL